MHIISSSETRTKSQHQPNQRGVGSMNKNARMKFQLFLTCVLLKTKIISMFYFRSERILTKDQETQDIKKSIKFRNMKHTDYIKLKEQ